MDAGGRKESFSQKARIKKSSDFLLVLKARGNGVIRLSRQWLELKAVLSSGSSSSNVGLTVGKQYARRAVDRNLIKRILREAARKSPLTQVVSPPGLFTQKKIVLRLKKRIPSLSEERCFGAFKRELREDADRLLCQLEERIKVLDQRKSND